MLTKRPTLQILLNLLKGSIGANINPNVTGVRDMQQRSICVSRMTALF